MKKEVEKNLNNLMRIKSLYTRGIKNSGFGKNYDLAIKYSEIALNSTIPDWEKIQVV